MSEKICLCIGAPRSGTTWLYNVLSDSKSIFTPAIKEIRHFYSVRSEKEKLKAYAFREAENREEHRVWLDRWVNENNTDEQYVDNLLSSSSKPVAMDISPAYSIAPLHVIKRIKSVIQDAKIIYILRDPVEREYSNIDLEYHLHGKNKSALQVISYLEPFAIGPFKDRGDYKKNIERWSSVFGKENLLVLFYDNISKNPIRVLEQIYNFLSLDIKSEDFSKKIEKRFGGQNKKQVGPGEIIKPLLSAKYLGQILELSKEYPVEISPWYDNCLSSILEFEQGFFKHGTKLDLYKFEKDYAENFESLGDNCEFGFFLRACGIERSSLFKWAVTPIESLNLFLEDELLRKGFFSYESILPYAENMVIDTLTSFAFHSKMKSERKKGELKFSISEVDRREIYNDENSKIRYQAEKFFSELCSGNKTYFVKKNAGLVKSELIKLNKNLKRYNSKNELVVVRQAVKSDSPGQVNVLSEGFYEAVISRFAPYGKANEILVAEWYFLFKNFFLKKNC